MIKVSDLRLDLVTLAGGQGGALANSPTTLSITTLSITIKNMTLGVTALDAEYH
jgi:hypothetical protein